MLYDVYVQGKPYKSIEAQFTHQVLTQVTLDIQNDLVPGHDHAKPHQIVVRPAHLPQPHQGALDAMFTAPAGNTPAAASAPAANPNAKAK
jgi:hypothetical protein